ncbi:MAG: transporter [Sphingomonadales bacterium]|nr:transporter [Sphingomonadales bacterium]
MTRHVPTKPMMMASAAVMLFAGRPVAAQVLPDEVSSLRAQLSDMQAREAAAVRRVNELEARLERLEQSRLSDADTSEVRGRYVHSNATAWSDDPAISYFQRSPHGPSPDGLSPLGYAQSSGAGDESQGQGISGNVAEPDRKAPAPTDAEAELAAQRQGRFGDRIGLELGAGYTHFDSARINLNGFLALDSIFLGTLSIDQVTADLFTFDPTLRVGVNDRLFLDANVPYLYRTSNFRSGGAGGNASGLIEESVSEHGFGDLNFGVSYRLFRETNGRPDIVLNARVKAPTGKNPYGVELREVANSQGNLSVPERLSTGSGVWGGSLGVSALKTLDPMVVFGSLTYFRNFPRSFGDIDEAPGDQPGQVDVGDAFQLGAGLAYALNDRSSISMSYTQRMVSRSTITRDGQAEQRIVGSQANVGLVNLGATFSLGEHFSLLTNVGIGLTQDSPDMTVSFRIPYRF